MLHDVGRTGPTAMSRHVRLTVAKWFRDISLGARLSFFVALIVFGVVIGVAYVEVRSFEGHIERDLEDAARLGARSAADAIADRASPLDPVDIRDTLHDLVEADPVLDAISVIEADETGHLRVLTSTSTEERAEVLDLAGRAITTQAPITNRSSKVVMFALPVPHTWTHTPGLTLLGDAAHLMPPFAAPGAGLAMLDGAELARALTGHRDPDEAVRAYETALLPRAAEAAEHAARGLAEALVPDAPRGSLRHSRARRR